MEAVKDSDNNAIAIGLVCGTALLAAAVVAVVCYMKRRDKGGKDKGKSLRYLDPAMEDNSGSPRVLDVSQLPNYYDENKVRTKKKTFFISFKRFKIQLQHFLESLQLFCYCSWCCIVVVVVVVVVAAAAAAAADVVVVGIIIICLRSCDSSFCYIVQSS